MRGHNLGTIFHISNSADPGSKAGGLDEAICATPEGYNVIRFGWSGKRIPDKDFREDRSVGITTINNVTYVTVDLRESEFRGYYEGHANDCLWPLNHFRPDLVEHSDENFRTYMQVNERFARTASRFIKEDAVVLVHDYHLTPCGGMLREAGVRNPLGYFAHTPIPTDDLISELDKLSHAQRKELKDTQFSIFAYDLAGFQTERDMRNMETIVTTDPLPSVSGPLEARLVPDSRRQFNGVASHFGVFPVMGRSLLHAETARRMAGSRESLALLDRLGGNFDVVGLDRLDYSKGHVNKALALMCYCQQYPGDKIRLVQVAAPCRTGVRAYQDETLKVRTTVETAKIMYGDNRIHYEYGYADRDAMLGIYHMKPLVFLATSLRDGMHLGAFEFLTAQNPADPGVLVCSKYIGAATVLQGAAIMVDPREPREIAAAIHRARNLSLEVRQAMHRKAMDYFESYTNQHWLGALVEQTRKVGEARLRREHLDSEDRIGGPTISSASAVASFIRPNVH